MNITFNDEIVADDASMGELLDLMRLLGRRELPELTHSKEVIQQEGGGRVFKCVVDDGCNMKDSVG